MQCYMCDREGPPREAVALCRHCQVGLCPEHLAADLATPHVEPRYSCSHPLPSASAGSGARSAAPHAPSAAG